MVSSLLFELQEDKGDPPPILFLGDRRRVNVKELSSFFPSPQIQRIVRLELILSSLQSLLNYCSAYRLPVGST